MKAREATLTLLETRAKGATVCPSEVARVLASATGAWRDRMPEVHAAVDEMVAEGVVRLSWKGRMLPARNGPYRIRRAGAEAGPS
ncbi:DUF3253 domain-containing protein [Brevundimonas sp.]